MPVIPTNNTELTRLKGIHLWHTGLSTCSQRVRIALAELGLEFESHPVNLHAGENSSDWYQAIHPDGVVPALVDDGRLVIESVDIIDYLDQRQERQHLVPAEPGEREAMLTLMNQADQAQKHLKLLTFEFLFKAAPTMSEDLAKTFQRDHNNETLKKFHRNFRAGFERSRIEAAAGATDRDFKALDQTLSDGRAFLTGASFSLADIAWIPNFHRFELLGWSFGRYPHLQQWFTGVSARPSYASALESWEPRELIDSAAPRLAARQAEGDGIESYLFAG